MTAPPAPPGELRKLVDPAAVGHTGQPAEVATVSLFSASERSRYLTGDVHAIPDGMYDRA